MNSVIKAQWLAALRSGEYEQGSERLRDEENCFCCLGVLCDIASKEGLGEWNGIVFRPTANERSEKSFLPPSIVRWAGLLARNPGINGKSLTTYNDGDSEGENMVMRPRTFTEIADLIEQHL